MAKYGNPYSGYVLFMCIYPILSAHTHCEHTPGAVGSHFLLWRPGSRHVQKGGLWGLEPLPFFKIIQKCPSRSRTNNNDIVVNKTKCIWILINMTICTKQ